MDADTIALYNENIDAALSTLEQPFEEACIACEKLYGYIDVIEDAWQGVSGEAAAELVAVLTFGMQNCIVGMDEYAERLNTVRTLLQGVDSVVANEMEAID